MKYGDTKEPVNWQGRLASDITLLRYSTAISAFYLIVYLHKTTMFEKGNVYS